MTEALRIAIAEDEPELLIDLEETLIEFGHKVIIKAANGQELVEKCLETPPDLIITDIKMPGIDGLEAVAQCRAEHPVPIVILTAYHDSELIQRALKEQVMSYLVKPINNQSLKSSIILAMQRFKEFQGLLHQTANLEQAIEDRKMIERAKGILMARAELNEQDAFHRLQLLSSQKNRKMIEIARTIVEADEAFKG